jgi:S-adenosylmethionine-dependent methyltransferase
MTSMDGTAARFDAGAAAWASYNQAPLGRIRHEITWHNLLPCLPAVADAQRPPHILDAGGGSGEMALRLVGCGYRVWLLDSGPAMLEQAIKSARSLPAEARGRLIPCVMAVEDAAQAFAPRTFDAIFCHTLIEYLPEPRAALGALVPLLQPGGLLSVSFVNRHAQVLRHIWSEHDLAAAEVSLRGSTAFCAPLFGIQGEAHTAEEVAAWLDALGLAVVAVRGVRAFADFVPADHLADPAFLDALLELERAAAERPPYKQIARYVQLLARAPVEKSDFPSSP